MEKLDALDLLINALIDHEKRLDAITERLEWLVNLAMGEETVKPIT